MAHPILITRPQAQSIAFKTQLGAQVDVVISPVIAVKPRDVQIPDFDVALVTSSQAIKSLPQDFEPHGRRAICVGQATTRRTLDRGFQARFGGATVSDLMADFVAMPGVRYLHVRGNHTTGDLVGVLAAKGTDVADCIVYDQIEQDLSPDAVAVLQRGTPVVLPLFSPRSAQLLIDQMTVTRNHHAVCISNSVANICRDAGFSRIRVADSPTSHDMMVATLEESHRG